MKESGAISAKQEKLIAHLVTERTIDKACERSGVSTVTFWRWSKNTEFQKEYRKARRVVFENAVAKLQSLMLAAVECLEKNLSSENPTVELRAASIILDMSAKGIETFDLTERLESLEWMQKDKEKIYERIKSQDK
jgi:hypothetical protein